MEIALNSYDTETAINVAHINDTMEEALKNMTVRCREVFILSRLKFLSNSEIAEKLNISIRTVENYLTQASRILRSKINP